MNNNTNEFVNVYPFNLICKAFDYMDPDEVVSNVSLGGISTVLKLLNSREISVCEYRHRENMTYDQIGAQPELNISRERVRQLYVKALRKIKNLRRKIFCVSQEYHNMEEQVLLSEISNMKKVIASMPVPDNAVKEIISSEILIRDVDFSIRTLNILLRAGCTTLGDVTEFSEGEILHRRNCGPKSVKELVAKLHSYGLSLRKDESDEDL